MQMTSAAEHRKQASKHRTLATERDTKFPELHLKAADAHDDAAFAAAQYEAYPSELNRNNSIAASQSARYVSSDADKFNNNKMGGTLAVNAAATGGRL